MSEEEILKIIDNILVHAESQLLDYEALAIQGLLDLYNKEKEMSHFLQNQLDIQNARIIEYEKQLNLDYLEDE